MKNEKRKTKKEKRKRKNEKWKMKNEKRKTKKKTSYKNRKCVRASEKHFHTIQEWLQRPKGTREEIRKRKKTQSGVYKNVFLEMPQGIYK